MSAAAPAPARRPGPGPSPAVARRSRPAPTLPAPTPPPGRASSCPARVGSRAGSGRGPCGLRLGSGPWSALGCPRSGARGLRPGSGSGARGQGSEGPGSGRGGSGILVPGPGPGVPSRGGCRVRGAGARVPGRGRRCAVHVRPDLPARGRVRGRGLGPAGRRREQRARRAEGLVLRPWALCPDAAFPGPRKLAPAAARGEGGPRKEEAEARPGAAEAARHKGLSPDGRARRAPGLAFRARSGRPPRREPAVLGPLAGRGAGGAGRGPGVRAAGRAGVPAPPAPAPNEWLGPGAATRWRVAAAAIVSRRALPASCARWCWGPTCVTGRAGAQGTPGACGPSPCEPGARGGWGRGAEPEIPPGGWPSLALSKPPPVFFLADRLRLRIVTPPPAPRIAPLRAEVVVSAGSARCTEASGRDREPSWRPAAPRDGLSGRAAAAAPGTPLGCRCRRPGQTPAPAVPAGVSVVCLLCVRALGSRGTARPLLRRPAGPSVASG